MHQDEEFLRAALAGFEQQLRSINEKMEDIRQKLRGKNSSPEMAGASVPRKKHRISAKGREAIRQAQIKRWKAAKAKAA